MPKFPEHPNAVELAKIPPQVHSLSAGTELWRVYFQGGRHPTVWNLFRSWGPTNSRFDHHEPPPHDQSREILYAALLGLTSLAEVFQDTRVINRTRNSPWLVAFCLDRDVPLLDLTGNWPTQAGASMVINSGPRPRAQRWSRVIYEAYPDIEGIYYPSSMYANQPAVALYERATSATPTHPTFHRALDNPLLRIRLVNAAIDLGYGLM